MALVAGCGGSDVSEASNAADNAISNSDTGTTDTGMPGSQEATVPGAPVATGAPAAGPGESTAAAAADQGSRQNPATGPGASGGTGGTGGAAKGASGSSAGAATALDKLVGAHPLFGGSAACKPATLSELPFGNVSTMSGVLGELLAPVRPALETWVVSQNACGGLNGHRIKLYFDDDQGDPSVAASKVQNMIQSKKILAFVGNIQVLTIDAVVPIIKRAGIPMIGGDLVSNTWYTNPLLFPQGPGPGGVAWGYLYGMKEYFNKKNIGDIWCIEVPRACEQLDRAFKEMAPQMGLTVKKSLQHSLTQPSFVQQCLEFKNAGVEALALVSDAASMNRMARSCTQVQYFPKIIATSLGVGNERQFLTGNKWLADAYVPMTYFPWYGTDTAVQRYYQAAVKKYNPGFPQGGAAITGWIAGAMLTAAATQLSATNPTTAELLRGLYAFKGQKSSTLGGMTPPLTFREGSTPKVPYCMFAGISNATNTGWAKAVSTAHCTDMIAPSDPQKNT